MHAVCTSQSNALLTGSKQEDSVARTGRVLDLILPVFGQTAVSFKGAELESQINAVTNKSKNKIDC